MTSTPRRSRPSPKRRTAPRTNIVPFPRDVARARAGVRWSRVMHAQARIAEGYYERPEITERLLDALELELTD